jgi:hypothetical protein
MQIKVKSIIKGAGFFEGEVEGQVFKTGQIFIEEPFDKSKPNYKGFRTVEYKCENTDTVRPIMTLDFPINADVTMEMSATKRGQVVVVTEIKPIGSVPGQPRAAS